MGQRKQIEDRERLAMLLQAVGAHPWARTELLRSHSGLHQGEYEAAVRLARRYRLVTRAVIRGLGQTPARYGLTPAGAERAGLAHSAPGAEELDHRAHQKVIRGTRWERSARRCSSPCTPRSTRRAGR